MLKGLRAVEWKKEMVMCKPIKREEEKKGGGKTKGFNHSLVFQRFGEHPEERPGGCWATKGGQGCPGPHHPSAHRVPAPCSRAGSPQSHLLRWHAGEREPLCAGRVGARSMCVVPAGKGEARGPWQMKY